MVFVKKMCSVKIEKGEKFRTFFFSGWSVKIIYFLFDLIFIFFLFATQQLQKIKEKRGKKEVETRPNRN